MTDLIESEKPAPMKSNVEGFDPDGMYRTEQFTDLKHGDLYKFTPVNKYGMVDGGSGRKPIWKSNVMLVWRGQQMAVPFEIDAVALSDAIEKFPEAADKAARAHVDALEKVSLQQQLRGGGVLNAAGQPMGISTTRVQ